MLVLSRKIQEQIFIPAFNIRVTVLSVGKNRVQLGIEAPKDVQVTRPDATNRTPVQHELRIFEASALG
ncbi:MAG TPA: carbon storage regulator [Planctomycetaceae bacterium]|nr:carbon storage regulator [Planctomycetaceae bacterium]